MIYQPYSTTHCTALSISVQMNYCYWPNPGDDYSTACIKPQQKEDSLVHVETGSYPYPQKGFKAVLERESSHGESDT